MDSLPDGVRGFSLRTVVSRTVPETTPPSFSTEARKTFARSKPAEA